MLHRTTQCGCSSWDGSHPGRRLTSRCARWPSAAAAQPLGTVRGARNTVKNVGGYYMEEVRRELLSRFGETAEDGPNSVYAGGLWVRTSVDPAMQEAADNCVETL